MKNRWISAILAIVMVGTIIFQAIPPLPVLAADVGEVMIVSPAGSSEIAVGDEVSIVWKRTVSRGSYFQIVVKQLDNEPAWDADAQEDGITILNIQKEETSSGVEESYCWATAGAEAGYWYKIYVKGFYSDGSVSNEADAVYIQLVEADSDILNVYFSENAENDTEYMIAADGYDDNHAIEVRVNASDDWTVSCAADWLTFTRESGTSQDTGFSFYVDYNTDTDDRIAYITVECGVKSAELTLKQYGAESGNEDNEDTIKPDDGEVPGEIACVASLEVSPESGVLNGNYVFTAYAENTDYVLFVVSSVELGIAADDGSGKFVCEYDAFTSAGTRTVYAYPCDEAGWILANSTYCKERFTITSEGTLDAVKFTTANHCTISVGSSITAEWEAPAQGPDSIRYNIYVWYDDITKAVYEGVEEKSITIPADIITKEGMYKIAVYAVSETWSASSAAVLSFYVEADVPTLTGFGLSGSAVSLGDTLKLYGQVDGADHAISNIEIRVKNMATQSERVYATVTPYSETYDLNILEVDTSRTAFGSAGSYQISVYACLEGGTTKHLLASDVFKVLLSEKQTLETPVISGAGKVGYGDNYTGTIYCSDPGVEYYKVIVNNEAFYTTAVNAAGDTTAFSIPASVFMRVSGSTQTNFTLRVTAMSSDTDTYHSSAETTKKFVYSGKGDSVALIKSVTLLVDGEKTDIVIGGTEAEFVVETTPDVTALRMKDGAGTFVVNTWYDKYTDSGSTRVWRVTQKINYAGESGTYGIRRMLTFYSMIGSTEYNSYNVSFYCSRGDTIGSFEIIEPLQNGRYPEGTDLELTWTEPEGTGADYYIISVVHNGVNLTEQTEVRGNTYTLDGSLLIQDNHAWKVQITARKEEAGWAENSAYTSFVLGCAHDRKTVSKEKILSCIDIGSSEVHKITVQYSYACADCGLTNVDEKKVTGTEQHTALTLDKGGSVCNKCWHLKPDGYSNENTYYLDISKAVSKEDRYVYGNVDKSGDPTGIQYNSSGGIRQIYDGDEITVLGEKGNCYLIEYPVGGAANVYALRKASYWGFMKKDFLKVPTVSAGTPAPTPNKTIYQEVVENYISKAFTSKSGGVLKYKYENEFYTADLIAQEQIKNLDSYTYNLYYNIADFGLKLDLLFSDNYVFQKKTYQFIQGALLNIPDDRFEEKLSVYKEVSKDNPIGNIVLSNSEAIWTYLENEIGISAENAEEIIRNPIQIDMEKLKALYFNAEVGAEVTQKISDAVDRINEFYDLIDENLIPGWLEDPVNLGLIGITAIFQNAVLQSRVSLEIFDVLQSIFGSTPEMYAIIERLRLEYVNKFTGALIPMAEAILENLAEALFEEFVDDALELLRMIASKFFPTASAGIPVLGQAITIINAFDVILGVVMEETGVADQAEASLDIALMYDLLRDIKIKLCQEVQIYENEANPVTAQKIYWLYRYMQGAQIYINNLCSTWKFSVEFTIYDDLPEDAYIQSTYYKILNGEIEHLNNTPIYDWKVNPYYIDIDIDLPDYSKLIYPYKILVTGYDSDGNDGLIGRWDDMHPYEKYLAAEEIKNLLQYQKNNITDLYILEIATAEIPGTDTVILFVNKAGEGLYIANFIGTKGFTILSAAEVQKMLRIGAKGALPDYLFLTEWVKIKPVQMHMNKYAVFGHTIAMASPILSWMLMKPTSELLWYFEGSIQDLSDVADAIRTTAYIHVPAVPAEVIYSADSNYENDMLCYLTLKTAFHDYKKNSIEDDLKAMLTKVFDTSYADKNNFLRSIDMALLGSFVNDVTRVDYVSK